ncbi:Ferredoxin-NADP reductase [Arboricoccus pini]|uniref:Ferredoxin-NADP reductase n=1 Tax=Arboricoccus pini TaxID=1963835 RepID=A0A212RPU4_9PROT|nr:hybrid-cluster NAD(P)-dependent oxidoreductase [Arboricoccus pini]SNB74576.1 Ferredoxin-NADP reductase [Arboricoccus pini]
MSEAKTVQDLVDLHDELASIMFLIFISIADCEKDITPHDVQHFHRLLSDGVWTMNEDIRKGLAELQRSYSSMWGAYEAGRLVTGPTAVADALARIGTLVDTGHHADLMRALDDFVTQLAGDGRIFGHRFTLGNESRSRAQVRSEIRKLIQQRDGETLFSPPAFELAAASPPLDLPSVEGSPLAPALQAERRAPANSGTKGGSLSRAEAGSRSTPAKDSVPPANATSAAGLGLPAWPPPGITRKTEDLWQGGKMRLRCVSVTIETHDVKTYSFCALRPCFFSYKPGQFVTVEAPIGDRLLRRTYTLSSSPSRPFTLSISVKRVPLGWISNWLWDEVIPGFELDITGPGGDFTCVDHPSPKLLFIAAGIGITPIISMLRWIADTEAPTKSVVIYNVRSLADVAFAQELSYLNARLQERLRLVIVPKRLVPGQSWHGLTGPFTPQLLRAVVDDLAEREAFVCGPSGYMDMVESLLLAEGLPRQRLHSERFGGSSTSTALASPPAVAPRSLAVLKPSTAHPSYPTSAAPAAGAGRATVTFRKTGKTVVCATGETILDAATRESVDLQSSCRSGICGACKIKRIRGRVDMPAQQVLSEDDIADGFVLTCVGQPQGDVLLDA